MEKKSYLRHWTGVFIKNELQVSCDKQFQCGKNVEFGMRALIIMAYTCTVSHGLNLSGNLNNRETYIHNSLILQLTILHQNSYTYMIKAVFETYQHLQMY